MADLMHPLAEPLRLEGSEPDGFLMLHGWTGSPAHFHLAARFVNDRGYAASVPLLAGHGTTPQHMMNTGWRDWTASAVAAYLELVATHERVHVVGLSMGGIIGLLLGATSAIASITTINAPQRLHNRRARIAKLYRGSSKIRHGDPKNPPADEAAEYWVQYGVSPLGTLGDLFDLMDAATAALGRITAPAVIIQSRADETVHHESAQTIYDGLGSVDKRVVWLEQSRHVALLDAERHVIHKEILGQAQRLRTSHPTQ